MRTRNPVPSDLIDRYVALPPMTMREAARALDIPLGTLSKAKREAGLTIATTNLSPTLRQADWSLTGRYLELGETSFQRAARLLGTNEERLQGALNRTGTARLKRIPLASEPTPTRRGAEALPAGHPLTWDILGWGPWSALK